MQINERTSVPLGWFFGFIAALVLAVAGIVGGAVLYVTDMKTSQAVDSVRLTGIDNRVSNLESSFNSAVLEIRNDIKELMRERKKTDSGYQ